MKVLAINGSPHKQGNTATMLTSAIEGAQSRGTQVELTHLYDLNYTGCTGCMACKLLSGKSFGRCAWRDDLTPVLSQAIESDVLLLASPIYWRDLTGMMRSFLERLWFPTATYTKAGTLLYPKRIRVGLIFTTNVPASQYADFYGNLQQLFSFLLGPTEYVTAEDTWQFDDYARYAADRFDPVAKKQQHDEVFPTECRSAYEMGRRLTEGL